MFMWFLGPLCLEYSVGFRGILCSGLEGFTVLDLAFGASFLAGRKCCSFLGLFMSSLLAGLLEKRAFWFKHVPGRGTGISTGSTSGQRSMEIGTC